MRIWFFEIGEPLPFLGDARLLRYGELTRELVKRGHQITWWASDFSHIQKAYIGKANERISHDGIDYVLVHGSSYKRNVGIRRLAHVETHAKNLRREIAAVAPPDLIVSAMPTIEASEVAIGYGKQHSVPVIIDIRDEWPEDYLRWLPPALRPLGRLALTTKFKQLEHACAGAAALFAVSERQLHYGLRHARRKPTACDSIVYTGAPMPPELPPERNHHLTEYWRARGITSDQFVCVFSGTLSPSRPLIPIIDATIRLANSIPIKLVIAGAGDSESDYRRRAQGHPAIDFAGWVDREPLKVLLDLADVLVAPYHPSFGFSLPTKMFDYMAAGRAMLSSCPGEAAALIESHQLGINYTFDNTSEIERAILMLHESPGMRREMGARARMLFEAKFNLQTVVADYASKLESLCQNFRERHRA